MKRVLIVDDAAFMRNSLKIILERNSFEVVGEAENGLIAVSKYNELKPDIVTMDITMPKMDGIESLQIIRKNDSLAKVIMISAMGQESYVIKAITLGAKGFIVKPWKEDDIVRVLNNI
jgi:Response regulator containing CheY-like receiver domain and AraC-type DNA-binding domain